MKQVLSSAEPGETRTPEAYTLLKKLLWGSYVIMWIGLAVYLTLLLIMKIM